MRAVVTFFIAAGVLVGGASTAIAGSPTVKELLAAQDELYARACEDRAGDGHCADVNPVRAALWHDYVGRAQTLRPLLTAGSMERADLELRTGFALRALDLLDPALAMLEEAVGDYGGVAGAPGREGLESALAFIRGVHLKRFDFERVAQTEERIAAAGRLAPAARTNAARNAVLLYVALDRPTDAARVRATVAGLASRDEALTLDWVIASTDWNAWRSNAPDEGANHARRVRALAAMQLFVRQFEHRPGAERPVLEALWRIAELRTPDGARRDALLPIVQAAKAIDGTRPDDDQRRAWGAQAQWELLDGEIARDFDGKPERSANTTVAQFFGQVAPAPLRSAPLTAYGTLHDLLSETRSYELRIGALDTLRWPSGGALYHARCGDLRDQLWRAIQLQPPTAFSMSDAIATDAMLDYRWALDWARAKQEPLPAHAAIRLRYLEWRLPAVAGALPLGLAPRPADEQAFSALVVTRASALAAPAVAAPAPVP